MTRLPKNSSDLARIGVFVPRPGGRCLFAYVLLALGSSRMELTLHVSTHQLRRGAFPSMSFLSLCLSGCVVGPDFHHPIPPATGSLPQATLASSARAGGEVQHFAAGRDVPGDWWRLFHSAALDQLVERAIRNNPDVKSAEAALRSAQANVEAQRGAFFPQISAGFSPMRQKVSTDPLVPSTSTGSPYYTTYTASLTVSYVADVFGGNRRQVEALGAQAEVQTFQLEAVHLTLTANLALAAIQQASLRAQIGAVQKSIGIEKELLALQKSKFSAGQIGELDVSTQEAALAQAEQSLPPLEKQLSQQKNQLIALSGYLPGEGVEPDFDFVQLKLPEELPVSLPSSVVKQRPDVLAAEANMHAATALVGVAIANRLPQFNIAANGGTMSSAISNVLNFSPPYSFWMIAGSATQVLFDGFTLEQKQRAAEAGLDQAAAQYRSAVVLGFQNVADSLQALDYDAKALRSAILGERAAATSLNLVRKQLSVGQVDGLQVLNAEQTYLQANLAAIQAKAARYADTVALFQALGGGWWNRLDVPPPEVAHAWWDVGVPRIE